MRSLGRKLQTVPGRGIVSELATQLRIEYLDSKGIKTDNLSVSSIDTRRIRNNIESYIGSVEIPLGLVGPLLFSENNHLETSFCAIGTLEGALVASLNRGAKAISESGGFTASIKWQKMNRYPMFIFEKKVNATTFLNYTKSIFSELKEIAEKYSNHAKLISIEAVQFDEIIHLLFNYTTGDAAGQNMTTICTWHSILFLLDQFKIKYKITPKKYVIEGNGASDKKVSQYSINNGRGINVTAECILEESVVRKILRTTSSDLVLFYHAAKQITEYNGMVGFNVNVANLIAGIFVATGQDLGSLHESSVGILKLKLVDEGVHISLNLPNLVIGTVGGGTHLPKQSQALELMNCFGVGKVERFAKLIAGFAMGLEISTFAAIVSGEFAKAHEKLGRNKPINWLLRSDLTQGFIKNSLNGYFADKIITNINLEGQKDFDNGIITEIVSKISKKLIGFIPISIEFKDEINAQNRIKALIKSKALDIEVIKGLHAMAASIDPEISDLININQNHLEYKNTHQKETDIYIFLNKIKFEYSPKFYGYHIDVKREIYYFIQELIDHRDLKIINSENTPELWSESDILKTIDAITEFHQSINLQDLPNVSEFKPWKSISLYKKLMTIVIEERTSGLTKKLLEELIEDIDNLNYENDILSVTKTIIHNDFNPRNVMVKKDGKPIIYDWELAVIDFPHRDIIEFLSFVLNDKFTKDNFIFYLKYHFDKYTNSNWGNWINAYIYSLKVYIISRISFYEVSGILIKYDFSNRILNTALKMLKILKEERKTVGI